MILYIKTYNVHRDTLYLIDSAIDRVHLTEYIDSTIDRVHGHTMLINNSKMMLGCSDGVWVDRGAAGGHQFY